MADLISTLMHVFVMMMRVERDFECESLGQGHFWPGQ